jgi:hypothetical protein
VSGGFRRRPGRALDPDGQPLPPGDRVVVAPVGDGSIRRGAFFDPPGWIDATRWHQFLRAGEGRKDSVNAWAEEIRRS